MGDVNLIKTLAADARYYVANSTFQDLINNSDGSFVLNSGSVMKGPLALDFNGAVELRLESNTAIESSILLNLEGSGNPDFKLTNDDNFKILKGNDGNTFDSNYLTILGTNGNIGIGTATPTSRLDVKSSSDVQIEVEKDGGGGGFIGVDSSNVLNIGRTGPVDLAFKTNSTERLRVSATGKVGIGVTSPADELDVSGNMRLRGTSTEDRRIEVGLRRTGNGNAFIDLIGDTTYSNYGLRFHRLGGANSPSQIMHRGTSGLHLRAQDAGKVIFMTNDTERARVSETGNVGIGTGVPEEKLHIKGGSSTGSLIVSESTSTSQYSGGGIALMNGATSNDSHVLINTFIRDSDGSDSGFTINQIDGNRAFVNTLATYDLSDHFWNFLTNGSHRLRIDSSGNVLVITSNLGIGTTNPQDKIHISASSPRIRLTDTDTGVDHRINADSSAGSLIFDVDIHSEASGPGMLFNIQGTELMRIGAAGNVGIGTSSPQNKLHVAGTIRSTSGFIGDIKSSNGTKVIDNGTDGTDAKYEGLFWSYGGNKYNTETGTTYTLVRDDAGITKRINNGSGTTITVPANATVAFPIGTYINFVQEGAGQITFSAAGGVTLNHTDSHTKSKSRYAMVTLYKLDTNVWILGGSTAA
jgi:hypothetical protein